MAIPIKPFPLPRFPKTLIVGALATLADLVTLYLLVKILQFTPEAANVPSLLVGSFIQFAGNRYFIFKQNERSEPQHSSLSRQAIQFTAAEIAAFGLNAWGFYVLVTWTPIHYGFARPLASAVVFIAFSYPIWKIIFQPKFVSLFLMVILSSSERAFAKTPSPHHSSSLKKLNRSPSSSPLLEPSLPFSHSLKHPLEETIPNARESYYSKRLVELLQKWPPQGIPKTSDSSNPIWIQPIRTEGKPNYIGLRKKVLINAPLSRVENLIDDFEHYIDFFSNLNQVHVIARDENQITTSWERPAPVFFVPHTEYEQIYLFDKREPDRKIYRYQLKNSNQVNFADGLIVLEQEANATLLIAYDFFEADWGLLRAVAESAIWKNTLEGSFRGDLEFKTKAEHPDWKKSKIEEEVEKLFKQHPIHLEELHFLDAKDLSKKI